MSEEDQKQTNTELTDGQLDKVQGGADHIEILSPSFGAGSPPVGSTGGGTEFPPPPPPPPPPTK